MQDAYSLRPATAADAALIAHHRGLMFLDMGLITPDEAKLLRTASEPWLSSLLTTGKYKHWFLEEAGAVIAGGGLHLREIGPIPGCLRVAEAAHIANMYTQPSHRKRGLARRLMRQMLIWCEENQVHQITLSSSDEGRSLYVSLGFERPKDTMALAHAKR